jgi:hypothetical protein
VTKTGRSLALAAAALTVAELLIIVFFVLPPLSRFIHLP